jgi:hypothetical protein
MNEDQTVLSLRLDNHQGAKLRLMRGMILLLAAVMLGLGGGYAWSKWSKPSAADAMNARTLPSAKPGQTSKDVEQSAYYANCSEARAAGKAPLLSGQPGYRAELDPDGDGVACQPGSIN